jgi:TolB protein
VPQAAAWSPSATRIVFTRPDCDECDATLWLMSRTGAGQRRLAGTLSRLARPSWSPDGSTIAVTALTGTIYAVDHRTGRSQRLTRGGAVYDSASWSPGGRRILASRHVTPANWDIEELDRRGTTMRRLTHGPSVDLGATWSPNGRRIAFERQDRRGVWQIWTMRADGSSPRQLTRGSASIEQPSWSPDGRRLAAVRATLTQSRIVVVALHGQLTQALPVTPSRLVAAFPAWSPDGRAILFSAKSRSAVEP